MAMIIALRVSKEGSKEWSEGTSVWPLFILTGKELSRMRKRFKRSKKKL